MERTAPNIIRLKILNNSNNKLFFSNNDFMSLFLLKPLEINTRTVLKKPNK